MSVIGMLKIDREPYNSRGSLGERSCLPDRSVNTIYLHKIHRSDASGTNLRWRSMAPILVPRSQT